LSRARRDRVPRRAKGAPPAWRTGAHGDGQIAASSLRRAQGHLPRQPRRQHPLHRISSRSPPSSRHS
jgi:hypothetical protein